MMRRPERIVRRGEVVGGGFIYLLVESGRDERERERKGTMEREREGPRGSRPPGHVASPRGGRPAAAVVVAVGNALDGRWIFLSFRADFARPVAPR